MSEGTKTYQVPSGGMIDTHTCLCSVLSSVLRVCAGNERSWVRASPPRGGSNRLCFKEESKFTSTLDMTPRFFLRHRDLGGGGRWL